MRCAPDGDHRFEDPQLLDPVDEHDPTLLSFSFEGRAVPNAHITDKWERTRVEYSIERYNLDFPPLMDKRKSTWADCWESVQEYLRELALYQADKTNGIARDRFKQAAKQLRKMMNETQELSAGDPRLVGLLQSA